MLTTPKLTSCDMFGMLLKYWLSTEGGFVVGERMNPVGVLASGGLLWHLVFGIAVGGDITRSCDVEAVLCDICCCDGWCCDVCCLRFADCGAVWVAAVDAAVLVDV